MSDEKHQSGTPGEEQTNPTVQRPSESTENRNELTYSTNKSIDRQESTAANLGRNIRSGERWLICIGIATLVMSSLIAWIYWGQLREMRKSTNAATSAAATAAAQLEQTQRPWVVIQPTFFGSHGLTDSGGFGVAMDYTLSNIGNSPAIDVDVNPELYLWGKQMLLPTDERQRFCTESAKIGRPVLGKTISSMYPTLFPKETTRPTSFVFSATRQEVDKVRADYGGALPAFAIICVTYSPTFIDSKRYVTGIIYELGRKIDDNGKPERDYSLFLDDLPPNLRLTWNELGSMSAQ